MSRRRLLTGFEYGALEAVDDEPSYKGPDSAINLTPRGYAPARNRVRQRQPIAKAGLRKASIVRATFVAWQAINPDRAGLEFLPWNQVFSYYSSVFVAVAIVPKSCL